MPRKLSRPLSGRNSFLVFRFIYAQLLTTITDQTIAKKKLVIWTFTGLLSDRLSEKKFIELIKPVTAQLPLIANRSS
jgi:hypothetical protein